ncbi:MAG TPA: acetylglutamate kinase [Gemmatimonadota bacterium]|nr:acetylglutamate kinase [Gemmatimonadota bacterium]
MRYSDPAAVDSAKPISGLKGALRYVRAYRNRVFVVKIGGEVAGDVEALDRAAAQVGLLHSLGVRVVLVHGGSRQASELSRRLGHEPRIVAGRRVTDDAAREVAIMVYGGTINVEILTALRVHHVPAVGLSGIDGELVTVTRRPPVETVDDDGRRAVVDFGWVGDVTAVDPTLVGTLLDARFVPVVACLASDEEGEVYNVNADTIAERIAVAMGAMKLIVVTGVPGVLRDRDDPSSIVSFADARDVEALIASGAVAGGMRPKVEACVRAAAGGVERTHIIDGRLPDAILQEVFTGAGCGTMIVNRREKADYPDVEPEE